jgi:hypothetical protein
MLEAERDPCAGPPTNGRLELRHACSRFVEPIDVARGIGEIRDQPRRDHGMVCRVGRVEQAVGVGERVRVAAAPKRGQHPSELRQRDRAV